MSKDSALYDSVIQFQIIIGLKCAHAKLINIYNLPMQHIFTEYIIAAFSR